MICCCHISTIDESKDTGGLHRRSITVDRASHLPMRRTTPICMQLNPQTTTSPMVAVVSQMLYGFWVVTAGDASLGYALDPMLGVLMMLKMIRPFILPRQFSTKQVLLFGCPGSRELLIYHSHQNDSLLLRVRCMARV